MPSFYQFQNGEGRSKYDMNGFDATQNIDPHSVIGTLRCQLALTSDSTTPNEACIAATAPNGDVYFFSTASGKTWKRTAAGVYSLVNTNANGAHLGALYYNGYIYYATSTKLGRTDLSTFSDTFQTFTITATYRPMEVVNLTLFIGNGKYVSSVNSSGTFTDNALDLPSNYIITALSEFESYLLIGTIIGTNVSKSKAFMWDTYSSSWTIEDSVDEIGINCFIKADGILFAQCGTEGNVYYWSGKTMEKYKQIRGVTTAVAPYNSTILAGKPLFAVGTKIYSIFRKDRDLPYAITHEYTLTTGTTASIGEAIGKLFVSTGSNIDTIGTSYATGKITIPVTSSSLEGFVVDYESMPSGCSLGLETNINESGWVSETFTKDTTNLQYVLQDGVTFDGTQKFGQVRVTLNPNGAATPIVQNIRTAEE